MSTTVSIVWYRNDLRVRDHEPLLRAAERLALPADLRVGGAKVHDRLIEVGLLAL